MPRPTMGWYYVCCEFSDLAFVHIHLSRAHGANSRIKWSNGRIIALCTITGVLLVAFAAVQILLPKTATLPPRIFKQRSVVAAFGATLCVNSGNYIFSKKTIQLDIINTWLTLDYSLLPPNLVSNYQRCLCCGVWHPNSASDVVIGFRISRRWIHKFKDRILLTSCDHRIHYHVNRGRAAHDL